MTELRSGPLLAYILLLAHSLANRAVSAGSGNNLLSNNAIKMKNKYLICHSARSEMRMNKGTVWVFSQNTNNLYFLDEYGRETG